MESVIQSEKECYVCGTTQGLHCHHVFFGNPNRKHSEKFGMKVWLCWEHHTGSTGAHQNRALDLHLKKLAQREFEARFGNRDAFRVVFGKSFL